MSIRVPIGLIGCGIVGGGVVEALEKNGEQIAQICGTKFEIVSIAVRDLSRHRNPYVDRSVLVDDWRTATNDPDIDLIIEATSGGTHPSYEVVRTALEQGKSVITANKELVALHGLELADLAEQRGVHFLFEASVLGGVPALHTLSTYFKANRIRKISGIVNGTSNYILTKMGESGMEFADALREAQAAGFAEEDPSKDIEGHDALSKLKILTRMAFHADLDWDQVVCQGITNVEAVDLELARTLGCKIKHVVQAELTEDGRTLRVSMGPVFAGSKNPLYHVDGVTNALNIVGNLVGEVSLTGPGAGSLETASAIVEDLIKTTTPRSAWLHAITAKEVLPVYAQAYVVRPTVPGFVIDTTLLLEDVTHIVRLETDGVEAWIVEAVDLDLNQLLGLFEQATGVCFIGYPLSGASEIRRELVC